MGSILFNILWIVLHNNVYLILWEQPLWRAPDIRMNRLSAACWCRVPCLARPGHWVTMSRPRSRQVTWQRLRHADASPPCHSQSRISSFKQTPTLFDSGNSALTRDISAQHRSVGLQLFFRKLWKRSLLCFQFEEFVNCVYLCNCLHEARGRPGWAGLRPTTIMDTITSPSHTIASL